MNKSPQIIKTSPQELLVLKLSEEQKDLIKKTLADRDATETELAWFFYQCEQSGLDPLKKQAHWMRDKHGKVTFIAGRDGLRARAEGFPDYRGSQAWAVCEKDTFELDALNGKPLKHIIPTDRGKPVAAWARVLREGREPTVVYVRFEEFEKRTKSGYGPWERMPTVMIEKVADSTAHRRAFPEQFSGVYGQEETGFGITGTRDIDFEETPQSERGHILKDLKSQSWSGEEWREIAGAAIGDDRLNTIRGWIDLTTEELKKLKAESDRRRQPPESEPVAETKSEPKLLKEEQMGMFQGEGPSQKPETEKEYFCTAEGCGVKIDVLQAAMFGKKPPLCGPCSVKAIEKARNNVMKTNSK